MTTKLEINIRSLLSHCEELAKSNDDANSWRIKKYIKSLDTMIKELEISERYTNYSGSIIVKIVYFFSNLQPNKCY